MNLVTYQLRTNSSMSATQFTRRSRASFRAPQQVR